MLAYTFAYKNMIVFQFFPAYSLLSSKINLCAHVAWNNQNHCHKWGISDPSHPKYKPSQTGWALEGCSSWGSIALRTAGSVCPCSLPPQLHNKSDIQQHSVQKAYMAHSTSRRTPIDSFHHKFSHKRISRSSHFPWYPPKATISIQEKTWYAKSACHQVLLESSSCIMHVARHIIHQHITCIRVACPLAYVCFPQLSRSISRSVSWSD